MLEAAAKTRLNWAEVSKEWDADLRTAAITGDVDNADALVPTFRLTPTRYRDYFKPDAASDIRYGHFTATPIAFRGHGPDTPFRIVFRRREEQKAFIERLQKEREADPLPKLHDDTSWQAWVRETWDLTWDLLWLWRQRKLEMILTHVSGYFKAFTVHAPHDLREGCRKNYLIHAFPRAITGSLVHDCFVYAVRWLHILGGILSPGSTPSGIANPRIFLIEMPAHVGVMIRADTTAFEHNAKVASISRELSDAVRVSWTALHQRLEAAKDKNGKAPPDRMSEEIRQHAANFKKAFEAANARLDKEREPLLKAINDDLAANERRVLKTKGVWIVQTESSLPFRSAALAYREKLSEAIRSRDLSAIHPAEFFPEDDFVAAVE